MSCDVGKAAEGLANEAEPRFPTLTSIQLRHSSFSNPSAALPTLQLILQPFRCFTYIIGTTPTSQVILQPFRCFTYVTGTSRTSPGQPPMHRGMKTVCGGLSCYSKLLSLEVATVLDSC